LLLLLLLLILLLLFCCFKKTILPSDLSIFPAPYHHPSSATASQHEASRLAHPLLKLLQVIFRHTVSGPLRGSLCFYSCGMLRHGVKRMSATPKKDGTGSIRHCLSRIWLFISIFVVVLYSKYVIAIFGVRASQLALMCKYHREWGAKTISAFNNDYIYQTAISLGWYYTSSFYSILVCC
jgi:hypothetical protein